MLLGGLRYLLPVIEEAHKLGVYVITADYFPNNIAHKYSDEYVNVSIIDKEAILKVARNLKIDGILSHAVDPGVTTAAYVAEQMGLPFQCSYEAACILQDKSRFRKFLADNGFNCPKARGYSDTESALKDVNYFNWPVIVKPVDSAGSKGVTKVTDPADLPKAIETALAASISKNFIIENFLEKRGNSSGSESFVVDGKLLYNGFYDQHFDSNAANPYTPSAEIWPSVMDFKHQQEIKTELQRLFSLLKVTTGIFNVECRVCTNNKAYLMEVSPRGGGNRLAEMLNYAADVNLIEAEVRKALGMPIVNMHEPNFKGVFAIKVLHSDKEGVFDRLEIDKSFLEKHIIETAPIVKQGDHIVPFTGANASLGTLFLQFNSREELDTYLTSISNYVHINIK